MKGNSLVWAFSKGDGLALGSRFILLTFVVIAAEADDWWIPRSAILSVTGLSKRTGIRVFRELENKGLISRDLRELNRREYFGAARWRAKCFELPESREVVEKSERVRDDLAVC